MYSIFYLFLGNHWPRPRSRPKLRLESRPNLRTEPRLECSPELRSEFSHKTSPELRPNTDQNINKSPAQNLDQDQDCGQTALALLIKIHCSNCLNMVWVQACLDLRRSFSAAMCEMYVTGFPHFTYNYLQDISRSFRAEMYIDILITYCHTPLTRTLFMWLNNSLSI